MKVMMSYIEKMFKASKYNFFNFISSDLFFSSPTISYTLNLHQTNTVSIECSFVQLSSIIPNILTVLQATSVDVSV